METATWDEFSAPAAEPKPESTGGVSFDEFAGGADTATWDQFANIDPYGATLSAPTMEQIRAGQWKQIRETLSPIIGYTQEQQAQRLEGMPRGILDGKPAITLPRIPQQDNVALQSGAGLLNAGAGLVEGLSAPGTLIAGMNPFGPVAKGVAGYFAADMAAHVPSGVQATIEAANRGNVQQAVEAGAGTLASAAVAIGAGKHAMGEFPAFNKAKEVARLLKEEISATEFMDSPVAMPTPQVRNVDWIDQAARTARGEEFIEPQREAASPPIEGGEFKNEAQRQGQEVLVEQPARETAGVPAEEPARPSPEPEPSVRSAEGAAASPQIGQGGALGETKPLDPVDNPAHTAFPVELPEAVEFSRQLLGGEYPKVVEKVAALKGRAAGVFKYGEGVKPSIELKASIAELLTDADRARIREMADEYAKAEEGTKETFAERAKGHYDELMNQALETAKRQNPAQALKVIWHEIGHVVDYIKGNMLQGRGNLFGHIAALKDYLRQTLPMDSATPDRPITPTERYRMKLEAERQMKDELGPIQEIVRKVLEEEPVFEQVNITPDDVKSLMGMDARERIPELYQWFASQSKEVKAQVVRSAMRGLLDERVAKLSGGKQVGTRTVEREVRQTVGREPTKAEIQTRFRELFEKELETRRMVQLKDLKAELEPMIAWWRGTPKMESYFATPTEMYAETFSVFMNNPAAMAKRAPKAYAMFKGWMDARPEVKALYDRIQDQIAAGTVMRERVLRLRETWNKDNERSVKTWFARQKRSAGQYYDNIIYHFDREFGPVYRRANVTEPQLKQAVGNYLYRAAEHEYFLSQFNTRVGGQLLNAGLDMNWMGEYLFHNRVVQERHSMFNPGGWTPKNSLERLSEMKAQLGPAKFAALEDSAGKFRELYESQVIPLMKEARLWSEELQTKIDQNVAYATFAVVRNIADVGIQRELDLAYGNSVTPHIYKQIGTLQEIKNPATATILKSLSLLTAAHRNIAKRAVVETMLREAPAEIVEADKRWNGKRWEPVLKDSASVGTIVLLEDGKAKAYYVPKEIAESLNSGPVARNHLQMAALKSLGFLKGMFTGYNVGFWLTNTLRDAYSFSINMPGLGASAGFIKNLPRAVAAARASVKGDLSNPIAEQLLRRKLIVSKAESRGVTSAVENEFDIQLASYGLDPVLWGKELTKMQKVQKALHAYLGFGQMLERVPKAAGMLYLDEKFPNMPEWQKAEIIREAAGSPNFLEAGRSKSMAELAILFFNPWKQGVRTVVNAARRNPGEFGLKLGTSILIPTALMAAFSKGAGGKEKEEQFASIPDYDLSNYLCLPYGWVDKERKKVAYVRLPLPDPLKIVHSAVFGMLTGRGQGYATMAGGQIPGMNPIIDTIRAMGEYSMGQNPVDHHTGRPIMDSTTFQAGGSDAALAMAKWISNAFGLGMIHRFQNIDLSEPTSSSLEEFLRKPVIANVVGRFIKVSNRGVFDTDKRNSEEIEQHRAQVRLAVRTMMDRWSESGVLDSMVTNGAPQGGLATMIAMSQPSEAERVLLREPYAMKYLGESFPDVMKARQSFLLKRLQRMPSRESKNDLLRREQVGRQP